MGVFKAIKDSWKGMSTTEKIGMFFDIVTMIGGGAIGASVGKKLSEGQKPITAVCVRLTCAGLGIAAGDIANHQLKESYGKPIAAFVDLCKEAKLSKDKKNEEEPANG